MVIIKTLFCISVWMHLMIHSARQDQFYCLGPWICSPSGFDQLCSLRYCIFEFCQVFHWNFVGCLGKRSHLTYLLSYTACVIGLRACDIWAGVPLLASLWIVLFEVFGGRWVMHNLSAFAEAKSSFCFSWGPRVGRCQISLL